MTAMYLLMLLLHDAVDVHHMDRCLCQPGSRRVWSNDV
jgi:hypothetical protein